VATTLPRFWSALPTGADDEAAGGRVSARSLRRFARDVLVGAGLDSPDGAATAQCLVLADLRGVRSHGVFRLMQYTDSIRAGEINVHPRVRTIRQRRAVAIVDADGGYGYRPALEGMSLAVSMAAKHGVGAVGVRNSHHFGMAAAFALRAAEEGAIGFVTTNSLPQIAPPGGSRAVVGNNPFAFAVPRRGRAHPLVVDIALTEGGFGTAALAALRGTGVAPGLALGGDGLPTTDAAEAMRSGILVAIGNQKGYALSVAAEVLAAALTGSPIGLESHCHRIASGGTGHFLLAVHPDAFIARRLFDTAVDTLCAQIKETLPAPGADGVHLPGELGWKTHDTRVRDGIPLPPNLRDQLLDLGGRLGVRPFKSMPQERAHG